MIYIALSMKNIKLTNGQYQNRQQKTPILQHSYVARKKTLWTLKRH